MGYIYVSLTPPTTRAPLAVLKNESDSVAVGRKKVSIISILKHMINMQLNVVLVEAAKALWGPPL